MASNYPKSVCKTVCVKLCVKQVLSTVPEVNSFLSKMAIDLMVGAGRSSNYQEVVLNHGKKNIYLCETETDVQLPA